MCFNVCLWGKSDWYMLCQSLGSQCVTKGQRTYTGSLKYCVWKLVSLCQENEWTNDTSTFDIPLSSILVSLFGKKGWPDIFSEHLIHTEVYLGCNEAYDWSSH